MKKSKFGEIILDEDDLCDLAMKGRSITDLSWVTVDPSLDLDRLLSAVESPDQVLTWTLPERSNMSMAEFDCKHQGTWFMPQQYHGLDIAQHVLDLCRTQDQLQRVGQELLLYQERNLFDLLRYLKYLVDVMRANRVIWGVGRGSSVASYVLFLLGVHRIDSIYYDLDIHEFLR
jgi:hypothetical protein